MVSGSRPRQEAVCNTCTVQLVALAYRRAPWFRLVREPLRLGMYWLGRAYRIDPGDYVVRSPECYRCLRFSKVGLKERSALFRRLNALVNPWFDAWLERIVSPRAVREAEARARALTGSGAPTALPGSTSPAAGKTGERR